MLRISVLIVVVVLALLYSMTVPASVEYWESVGPKWDEMLNPLKYERE
jgi:hypothetical protein